MKAKVCIVGPQGVGKSTIASRIDGATFAAQKENATTTFANCNILVGDKVVDLHILDVSGEEKLRCMGPIYCKDVKAALCVFDLSSEKTFNALQSWVKCVRQNGNAECILLILGNKSDIDRRQQTTEIGMKYAESIGAQYFEVSAITGKGLLNVLVYVAKKLLQSTNCYLSYAAKLSITTNYMEYVERKDIILAPRRMSLYFANIKDL